MIVDAVSSVNFSNVANVTKNCTLKKHSNVSQNVNEVTAMSVPANLALAQMPNVSFKGYRGDDLSKYGAYRGPKPPEIEQEKFELSCAADECLRNENYAGAIKHKLDIARICKSQGKEQDAYFLEEGVKQIFGYVPANEIAGVKRTLEAYNPDMARDMIDKIIG